MNSQEMMEVKARNFNMLEEPVVSQKVELESQGYFVTATGQVTTSQERHIVALLRTYNNGQMVSILDAGRWASVVKRRDARTQYIPGTSTTDQVVVATEDQGIAIRRTKVSQDKIVPYMTERHRMPGVAPVPRTTTKTIVMAIPASMVKTIRRAGGQKKGDDRLAYLRQKATKMLDEHPGTSLNSQTWAALLAKAGVTGTPSQFAKLMKASNARGVGSAMSVKCWTLQMATRSDSSATPVAHPEMLAKTSTFVELGPVPSKRMLAWCAGDLKSRSHFGKVPVVTVVGKANTFQFTVTPPINTHTMYARLRISSDGRYAGMRFDVIRQ